jgi:hypothetical protein
MSNDRTRGVCAVVCCALAIAMAGSVAKAQVASTWTGGASDGLYSSPGNWSTDPTVPLNNGSTYNVTISPGTAQTIRFDVDTDPLDPGLVNNFILGPNATFLIDPGEAFGVNNDAEIGGVISASGAATEFRSQTPGTQFTGNRARVLAAGGATIAIDATSLDVRGYNSGHNTTYTILSAVDAGTLLDLSQLTLFNAGFYNQYDTTTLLVQSTNSAHLDLSGLQTLTGPGHSGDRLRVVLAEGGTMDLSSLQTTNGYVRFETDLATFGLPSLVDAAGTSFSLEVGTTLSLPELVTFSGGTLAVPDSGTLSAPKLANFTGSALTVGAGGVVNAPTLTAFTNSTFTARADQNLTNLATFTNIDNSRIAVEAGRTFAIAATTLTTTGLSSGHNTTYDLLRANGAAAVYNAASLTEIDAGFYNQYDTTTHRVLAEAGGAIDLSGVSRITGPGHAGDVLLLQTTGGGTIDLSNLQQTSGYVRFSSDGSLTLAKLATASNTSFTLAVGKTLDLPMMTTYNGGTLAVPDSGILNAPQLVSFANGTLTAGANADLNAPNLVAFTGSVFDVRSDIDRTDLGTFANIDNSRISVADNTTFTIAASSLTATGLSSGHNTTYTLLSASGANAIYDASSLTSIDSGFYNSYDVTTHRVLAEAGGRVDLSGVQTLAGPTHSGDKFVVSASGGGAVVDLSNLQQVTGHTRFDIGAQGAIRVGNFTVTGGLTVNITDISSTFDVNGSLLLAVDAAVNVTAGGGFSVSGDLNYDVTSPTQLDLSQGIVVMDGAGSYGTPQNLEVGGEDRGLGDPGDSNFGIGQLVIGTVSQATVVNLYDWINNDQTAPNDTEALYLFGAGADGLVLPHADSVLVLNHIPTYAWLGGQWVHLNQELADMGVTQAGISTWSTNAGNLGTVAVPEPATLTVMLLATAGALGRRRRAATR